MLWVVTGTLAAQATGEKRFDLSQGEWGEVVWGKGQFFLDPEFNPDLGVARWHKGGTDSELAFSWKYMGERAPKGASATTPATASATSAAPSGKRVDPVDGTAYTWEEFRAHYRKQYSATDLEAYWWKCKLHKEERRVDPADSLSYTWEELRAHYAGKYTKNEMQAYWDACLSAAKKAPAREQAWAAWEEPRGAKKPAPEAKAKALSQAAAAAAWEKVAWENEAWAGTAAAGKGKAAKAEKASLEFATVSQIDPETNGLNFVMKVLSHAEATAAAEAKRPKFVDVVAGDRTGIVTLQLSAKEAAVAEVGKVVEVHNGFVKMVNGYIRLKVGKKGSIAESTSRKKIVPKNTVDVSATEYELVTI